MKKIYLFLSLVLLLVKGNAQPIPGPISPDAYCRGYLIPFLDPQGFYTRAMNFTGVLTQYSQLQITQNNNFTGIGTAEVIVTRAGWCQFFFRWNNGSNAGIDFTAFPYVSFRAKTKYAGVKDVPMHIDFKGTPQGTVGKDFPVLKGDGQWHVVALDLSEFKPIGAGDYDMAWWFNDTCTVIFDEVRWGSIGDPDSTVKLSIDTLPPYVCEKDAGQQSITLTGISNGTNVDYLSLSQTNTKSSLFEGTPTFSAVNPDGTATLTFTPKAGAVGVATMHVVLTYHRAADTVTKYKSIWFDINVVQDPKMTVASSVKAQVNQPKVIISITNATNSTGGASGLTLDVSSTNPVLVTNLVADPVKSDGTSRITFIPGQDQCGYDTITAVLTDSKTARSATYKIAVEVSGSGCVMPQGTENARRGELSISPNPAAEVITVSLPDNNGGKVQIVDITGKTVKEVVIPSGQSSVVINIASLSKGMYFVSDVSRKVVRKLVVQ